MVGGGGHTHSHTRVTMAVVPTFTPSNDPKVTAWCNSVFPLMHLCRRRGVLFVLGGGGGGGDLGSAVVTCS